MESLKTGFTAVTRGLAVNASLAVIKIVTGVVGSSYALIADGIESTADIVSSLIVFGGLRFAARPPDDGHPYGHGKAESIAGAIAALGLLVAAALIAVQSVREILVPHQAPAWFTLPVLVLVIATKEILARYVLKVGQSLESTSLRADAWHHRSDAITSVAVLVGITIALIGGPGWESADDWAALLACGIIAFNGIWLLRAATSEIMDATVSSDVLEAIRREARGVSGVQGIEKIRARKSGLDLLVEIHVEVLKDMTIKEGHSIAHEVKDHLINSGLRVKDVVVHVEPKMQALSD